MTILNQSIERFQTGDVDGAWEIAKNDPGLLPTVTKEMWIKFAQKCVERRLQDEILQKRQNEIGGL